MRFLERQVQKHFTKEKYRAWSSLINSWKLTSAFITRNNLLFGSHSCTIVIAAITDILATNSILCSQLTFFLWIMDVLRKSINNYALALINNRVKCFHSVIIMKLSPTWTGAKLRYGMENYWSLGFHNINWLSEQ